MEVKDKVYKLLYELFSECPYNNMPGYNEPCSKDSFTRILKITMSEKEQIWTILSEILPSCIIKENGNEYYINWHKWRINEHFNKFQQMIIYQMGSYQLLCSEYKYSIFEAILSLLKAIKTHPGRDKFKYVWGEK